MKPSELSVAFVGWGRRAECLGCLGEGSGPNTGRNTHAQVFTGGNTYTKVFTCGVDTHLGFRGRKHLHPGLHGQKDRHPGLQQLLTYLQRRPLRFKHKLLTSTPFMIQRKTTYTKR